MTKEAIHMLPVALTVYADGRGTLHFMRAFFKRTFGSLGIYNYRVWAAGAIVSNIGTWMQRTAQDWLVLTELTRNNATCLGIVVALQFGPRLLLLPVTGYVADAFDKRKMLYLTQSTMGLLALVLGLLSVTGVIQLWEVYALAFLQGCATAFDAPVRQTFVGVLVPDEKIANAVALNSTSFNCARMVGPAIAGVLIVFIGTGWLFLLNAVSFGAVLVSLGLMDAKAMRSDVLRKGNGNGGLLEGFAYVWRSRELHTVMVMMFFVGTFAVNFPVYISTMCVKAFHAGSHVYGFLTSVMAVGTLAGALLATRRERPDVRLLAWAAFLIGVGFLTAIFMPNYYLFGLPLILIGISVQTIMVSSISFAQLSADPEMRGRVVAILFALSMGFTPLGAPVIGWVADVAGPRAALWIGAVAGLVSAGVGFQFSVRKRRCSIAGA